MKNRITTASIVFMMLSILAGCSAASGISSSEAKAHIYVITPSEDHGWTGAAATRAKEKAAEINAEGVYSAEVITSSGAADQIMRIEDVVANSKANKAMVVFPLDDTVQSAIQSAADAGIPYCIFDRIIEGLSPAAVSNITGDNEGAGAGAAAYFVSLGLKPGDEIYVYEGDSSSVTADRNAGFTGYLTGTVEFDGRKIADADRWTEAQLHSIAYSGSMNWSRSNVKAAFESLMGDPSNAGIKWFFTSDDEFALGMLEALNGGGIDDETKNAFLSNRPVITGIGGLSEYYEVLRGDLYPDISSQLDGMMSVTFNPAMIKTAIQDMVDYLDGRPVEHDHIIPCENVTGDNVDNYVPFD